MIDVIIVIVIRMQNHKCIEVENAFHILKVSCLVRVSNVFTYDRDSGRVAPSSDWQHLTSFIRGRFTENKQVLISYGAVIVLVRIQAVLASSIHAVGAQQCYIVGAFCNFDLAVYIITSTYTVFGGCYAAPLRRCPLSGVHWSHRTSIRMLPFIIVHSGTPSDHVPCHTDIRTSIPAHIEKNGIPSEQEWWCRLTDEQPVIDKRRTSPKVYVFKRNTSLACVTSHSTDQRLHQPVGN